MDDVSVFGSCRGCLWSDADPAFDDTNYEGFCGPCAYEDHEYADADRRMEAYRYGTDD